MSIPIKPLGHRVLIQADVDDQAPTETDSGLLTAKTLAAAVDGSDTQESWFVGTVVALGPKAQHVALGQRVCFSWAAGQQVTVDGVRYLIMYDADVLAEVAA